MEIRTFLIADVRGYTSFTFEQGDEAAARLASRFADVVEEVARLFQGEVVELRGDEALVVFASARLALRCAVELQQELAREAAADPSLPLHVGIGLDAGEAIPVREGYRGAALNLAARLCSLAKSGDVFASEGVIQMARRTEGLVYVDRGQVQLKGLPGPVRVFHVFSEEMTPEQLPPLQETALAHPTNLPDEPTPFVGRERQLSEMREILRRPRVRLLTLTGPGGTGKTRLALEMASLLLPEYPDGAFVVWLAPLVDPLEVLPTIARTLGVIEAQGEEPAQTLGAHLRDKRLVLLLDNFEHILPAAASLTGLLDECRELRILVTSRSPLRLSRENQYPVPPLQIPDAETDRDVPILAQNETVMLFMQSARAVKPAFALTAENSGAVVEVCRRLEGLPLAVELAAARIKLLPPEALLARLDSSLKLLTGGARDLPERQQTLRGTIDWSYSLLDDSEQKLFRRLSVFVGGLTLEAAEAVAGDDLGADTLDILASLSEKSLLRQQGEEDLRFTMLETVREYAGEKLDVSLEGDEIRNRHARYFVELATQPRAALSGPDLGTWTREMELEQPNILAALRWLLATGRHEMSLRLGQGIWSFWWTHGRVREGSAWLRDVLANTTSLETVDRAAVLTGAGMLAVERGDYGRAEELFEQGIQLSRRLGEDQMLGDALMSQARCLRIQGRLDSASTALEESLSVARQLGSRERAAMLLREMGVIAVQRDQYGQAESLLVEALQVLREFENGTEVSITSHALGMLFEKQSKYEESENWYRESLMEARKGKDMRLTISALEGLARMAVERGDPEKAARLFGVVDLHRETNGYFRGAAEKHVTERALTVAHDTFDAPAWQRAWQEGRAMPLGRAAEYALSEGTS